MGVSLGAYRHLGVWFNEPRPSYDRSKVRSGYGVALGAELFIEEPCRVQGKPQAELKTAGHDLGAPDLSSGWSQKVDANSILETRTVHFERFYARANQVFEDRPVSFIDDKDSCGLLKVAMRMQLEPRYGNVVQVWITFDP